MRFLQGNLNSFSLHLVVNPVPQKNIISPTITCQSIKIEFILSDTTLKEFYIESGLLIVHQGIA